MNSNSRILILGGHGMVGQALAKSLASEGYRHVTVSGRGDCDLENRSATRAYLLEQKPEFVFHLAAKVGGIKANMADPVGFLTSNALINCHVLEACHAAKVTKTLVLASSCVYPRLCPQPMREEMLLTGPVEPTNEGYALGKILGVRLAHYYHAQYGMNVVVPCPSNIYGPGDTFDFARSHVLSALVRRFLEARQAQAPHVTLWGTGSARREFIHVDDVVRGMIFFMHKVNTPDLINLGPGTDVSIRELAEQIAQVTEYQGALAWDTSQPDGMPRKCMEVSRLKELGFQTKIELRQGIKEVIADFKLQSSLGKI